MIAAWGIGTWLVAVAFFFGIPIGFVLLVKFLDGKHGGTGSWFE